MNKPLIAAWVSAVIGLVAMRLLMGGNQVVAECAFGVQFGFVAALFFASTVLFERGARQSPKIVRKISAWVAQDQRLGDVRLPVADQRGVPPAS